MKIKKGDILISKKDTSLSSKKLVIVEEYIEGNFVFSGTRYGSSYFSDQWISHCFELYPPAQTRLWRIIHEK